MLEKNQNKDIITRSNFDKGIREVENLTYEQIKSEIDKWDLSSKANAFKKQRLITEKISEKEASILQKEFNFKAKKPLVREIDSHQIIHTLKKHGDETREAARGQIAVNKSNIAHYLKYIQNADLRLVNGNKIIYAKQINGHYVVIEEVFEAQDKIRFFDMWKGKGKINKQVLTSHSQRP